MILYSEAREILLQQAKQAQRENPSQFEWVSIEEAPGRISAVRVNSPENIPYFINSSMDGFAVHAKHTRQASRQQPAIFRVQGCVAAGDALVGDLGTAEHKSDAAWEIMTGAAMPAQMDAVAKIEDVEVVRDAAGHAQSVRLFSPIEPGTNLRIPGQDFRKGDCVLEEGVEIRLEHLLALASLGIHSVQVRARPRVSILSTGKELVSHKEGVMIPGKIRNSTGPYLAAALGDAGAEVIDHGIFLDDEDQFLSSLKYVLEGGPDIIVTTGAVSMGKYDFIVPALKRLGAKIFFHKAQIRPGKPILFARLPQGVSFFGLPGNPISSVIGLRFFVNPYLRVLQGLSEEKPIQARLLNTVEKPEGVRCFFKAGLQVACDGASVFAMSGQASFIVSSLLQSNAWVVLPEEGDQIPAGTIVDVYPLASNQDFGVAQKVNVTIAERCC